MQSYYLILKSLHIISVICWMAGILYLPRLFIYRKEVDGSTIQIFGTMIRRLLYFITTPSAFASIITGVLLISEVGALQQGWFHFKLLCISVIVAVHSYIYVCYRRIISVRKGDGHSSRFFRVLNEVPTLCMIVIVWLAVAKPF